MVRFIMYVCVALMFTITPFSYAQQNSASLSPSEAKAIKASIVQFLKHLKQGDVENIKSMIGGPLYKRMKVLLNKNKDYPRLLRKRFSGAQFKVNDALFISPEELLVNLEIYFPSGETKSIKLVLDKNQKGKWEVIDELIAY